MDINTFKSITGQITINNQKIKIAHRNSGNRSNQRIYAYTKKNPRVLKRQHEFHDENDIPEKVACKDSTAITDSKLALNTESVKINLMNIQGLITQQRNK